MLAGGFRERRSQVVRIELSAPNIIDAYASDGSFLGSIGWRPFAKGLFLCG